MASTESEIDFRKYRCPELTEHLSTIVSIPGALRTVVSTAGMVLLAAWIIIPVLFFQRVHWGFLIPLFFYGSLAAAITGGLLGMVFVVNSRLENMLKVVDTTLEISGHVSADVADLRDGTRKVPSPRRIVYGVYEHVVLPALEGVVRGQSKLLGGLIFRFYRWSLGRLIARALRGAEDSAAAESLSDSTSGATFTAPSATAGLPPNDAIAQQTEMASGGGEPLVDSVSGPLGATGGLSASAIGENNEPTSTRLAATLDRIDTAAQTSQRTISAIRNYLVSRGSTLRRVVIAPLTLLLVLATLAAVVPIVVVWFLT